MADAGYGDRNLGLVQPYPDSLLIQNGGRFYNLRHPPVGQTAATGDGVHDDTVAFQDAFDYQKAQELAFARKPDGGLLGPEELPAGYNFWIYVPNGTYLVSDTLYYQGAVPPNGDLTRVRIVGESREGTLIRLADNSNGFGDSSNPKPVLTIQSLQTAYDNVNAYNLVKNLTIETGKGNPGAVGLVTQGANASGMLNVKIVSGDGSGKYGIWSAIGALQGSFHDITVVGFDYGVAQLTVNPSGNGNGINSCYENLTLTGQNKAGFLVNQSTFSARNALVDESATGATAVELGPNWDQLVLFDSLLKGQAGTSTSAVVATPDATCRPGRCANALFLRNIVSTGFASVASVGGSVVAPGSSVSEYASSVTRLFDAGPATSLNLPVEQVPIETWHDPATEWANVEDYRPDGGLLPDGGTNEASDTAAIQAALNSSKPVVYFSKTRYRTTKLTVPATVERIDGLFASYTGTIEVAQPSDKPLFIENLGGLPSVVVTAQRDVVQKYGNTISNPNNLPIKFFIENGGGGTDANFVPSNGKVWARGIDIEYQPADFLASGGMLWIMGFKAEGAAGCGAAFGCGTPGITSVAKATNGSSLEVLGGFTYIWESGLATSPFVDNENSNVSFVGAKTSDNNNFGIAISETQQGQTRQLLTDAGAFPRYVDESPDDFIVPLYVGRVPDAGI